MKKEFKYALFVPIFLASMASMTTTLSSCSNGLDDAGCGLSAGVQLSDPAVKSATKSSLTLQSSVLSDGVVVKKGFVYSLNNTEPTVKESTIVEADETFTATIEGLTSGTEYYVRAFTYGDSRYSYSATMTIKTEAGSLDEQLANYVAPTYADDYTSIASWSDRNQWNLANVHDPSVVLAEDGYYYMYQTDASYGNAHEAGGHFHGRRSKDLVNWEYLGGTMQNPPSWIKEKLNEYRAAVGLDPIDNPTYGYWAPVVRKIRDGLYRMYYSVVVLENIATGKVDDTTTAWTERAFMGLMETSDPATNNWEDKGFVICSSSDRGTDWSRKGSSDWSAYFKWNAIDPTYIITPEGQHWMIYGSWHSGIVAVEMDAETGKVKNELTAPWGDADDIASYGQLIATRRAGDRWQGSEGPEIIYHDGYYYLFLAYDGLDIPYNTRVVRSQNITGPYVGIDGKDVTAGGDALPVVTHPYKFSQGYGWVGISHCAIFDDGQGNYFYASQGRLPANIAGINASNAVMMGHIRSIRWTEDGWPVVMPERYGAVPAVAITADEIAGTWEHIDLSYKYGVQKESSDMVLSADGNVTEGAWKGTTWTWDETKQILSFSNGVKVCVQREADWEATPRKHTLVYGGYTTTKTYWGKKK